MEKKEQEMTAARSLEIISKSLEANRREMSRQMGTPMLVWGVLVMVAALVIGHLWIHNGGPVWNLLWAPVIVVGFLLEYYAKKRFGEKGVQSLISRMVGATWSSFCFFGLGMWGCIALVAYIGTPAPYYLPFTGFLAFFMGFASCITGCIVNKNVLICSGIVVGFGGLIADFYIDNGYELLIIAAAALIGLVLPGLYFNRQSKECAKEEAYV